MNIMYMTEKERKSYCLGFTTGYQLSKFIEYFKPVFMTTFEAFAILAKEIIQDYEQTSKTIIEDEVT